MFDFFKELPGQEARIISELSQQSIASAHQLVGTQMHEKGVRVGVLSCSVLSDQDRKTSSSIQLESLYHVEKQIEMVGIVEEKKR